MCFVCVFCLFTVYSCANVPVNVLCVRVRICVRTFFVLVFVLVFALEYVRTFVCV